MPYTVCICIPCIDRCEWKVFGRIELDIFYFLHARIFIWQEKTNAKCKLNSSEGKSNFLNENVEREKWCFIHKILFSPFILLDHLAYIVFNTKGQRYKWIVNWTSCACLCARTRIWCAMRSHLTVMNIHLMTIVKTIAQHCKYFWYRFHGA